MERQDKDRNGEEDCWSIQGMGRIKEGCWVRAEWVLQTRETCTGTACLMLC